MQKRCQDMELLSGGCSAWPCHLNGECPKGERLTHRRKAACAWCCLSCNISARDRESRHISQACSGGAGRPGCPCHCSQLPACCRRAAKAAASASRARCKQEVERNRIRWQRRRRMGAAGAVKVSVAQRYILGKPFKFLASSGCDKPCVGSQA